MIWVTAKGNFLVENNMAPVPLFAGGFAFPTGDRFYESAEYYEIASSGRVLNKYGRPESIRLEDKLIVSSIHRVVDDTLYHFYWSQVNGHEAAIQVDKRLRKLRLHAGLLPFDPDAVIAAYEQAVAKLIEEQTYKPPPIDVMKDEAGNTFILLETTMTHKHVEFSTVYDRYMGEEMNYPFDITDYYRLYLIVPSDWYQEDAFAGSVEDKIHQAIDKSWLKDEDQQKHESLDFMHPRPSKPEAMNNVEVSKGRFYIFREDFTFQEQSLEEYKNFLGGLRAQRNDDTNT